MDETRKRAESIHRVTARIVDVRAPALLAKVVGSSQFSVWMKQTSQKLAGFGCNGWLHVRLRLSNTESAQRLAARE